MFQASTTKMVKMRMDIPIIAVEEAAVDKTDAVEGATKEEVAEVDKATKIEMNNMEVEVATEVEIEKAKAKITFIKKIE
jgi:septum formation topological specificity factor MinE